MINQELIMFKRLLIAAMLVVMAPFAGAVDQTNPYTLMNDAAAKPSAV